MYNNRRDAARNQLRLTSQQEEQAIQAAMQREEAVRLEKLAKKRALQENGTYKLIKSIATISDKYFIDPLLGFFLPGIGDVITSTFALPFLYFALFKVKSINLTFALLFNILLDLLIGAIPWLGDIFDAFHRANLKNFKLIVGYIEENPQTRKEAEEKAGCFFGLILLAGLICYGIYRWFAGWYESHPESPNPWKNIF